MNKNTTNKADLTREKLQQRLAALQQESDAYLKQAEQQLATYGGAIAMLEELLGEEDGAEAAASADGAEGE